MAIYLGKNKVSLKYIFDAPTTQSDSYDTIPTLTSLIDLATGNSDAITSGAGFMVSGTLLTWDETAEDEGWFITYAGTENKCTIMGEQDPSIVTLQTFLTFANSGEEITLVFRTRMGGSTLIQVAYPNEITTIA